MKVIKLNKLIEGTTLVPIRKESNGLLRCVCQVCGRGNTDSDSYVNMLYNESYLKENNQECRFCNYLKRLDKENKLGNKNAVDILINKEKLIKSGHNEIIKPNSDYIITGGSIKSPFTLGYPFKKEFGDFYVLGYIGKYRDKFKALSPDKLAFRCKYCGNTKIYLSGSKIPSSIICDNCSKQREIISEKKLKLKEKKQSSIKPKKEKPLVKIKSHKDFIRDKFKFDKYISSIQDKNPNCTVLDVVKEGNGHVTKLRCNKCGSLLSISKTKKPSKVECLGCKRKLKAPNYKGVLFRDHTNTVVNRLEIINQYGNLCDVKCIGCGKVQEGLDLFSVLSRMFCCTCDNSISFTCCSVCGKELKEFSIKDILNNKAGCTCSECKSTYDSDFYKLDLKLEDDKITLKKKISSFGEVGRVKAVLTDTNLIKESEPVYVGTDNEYYYRCRCCTHNTDLVLSNSEIDNYNHEFCDSSIVPKLLSKPKADDIKL